ISLPRQRDRIIRRIDLKGAAVRHVIEKLPTDAAHGSKSLACSLAASSPSKARQDRASHDPVLVLLRQKAQFLGEMRDSLPVGGLAEGVGEVRFPSSSAAGQRRRNS